MSNELIRFEYFLCGMAYFNHFTYLDFHWQANSNIDARPAAYLVGMGEHLVYLLIKVATFVSFFFFDLAMMIHYVFTAHQKSKSERALLKMRIAFGLLIFVEAAYGTIVDGLGVLCPPLAYRIHFLIRKNFTHVCVEKIAGAVLARKYSEYKTITPENAVTKFFSKVF